MSDVKEFVDAVAPLGAKIDGMSAEVKSVREDQDKIRGEVKKVEEWLADAEAKFEKARRGESVTDNLKAAIPDRFRRTIETFARTGSKDPVRDAAMEAWLKNHLKSQLSEFRRDAGRLGEENDRLAAAMGSEKAYLNENTTGQGSYAVPTIVEAELFRVIEDNGLVRNVARKLPMNAKTSNLVNLASNVTTYIVAELGGAITVGEPTINKVDLTAKDFVAYGQATLDVVQDEVVGLLNFFMVNAGEMIAQKEDQQALEGTTATGNTFAGLIIQSTTATAAIGYTYWQTMTTATNAPAAPTLANLTKCVYGPLHKGTRLQSAWFMHPLSWANVLAITSANVTPAPALWQGANPQSPLSEGNFMGYPVYTTNQIAAVTEGANIYFGAFGKGMVFGDRTGIDFMVSEHEKFQYGLLALRVIKRTGIAVPLPSAFSRIQKTLAS